MVYCWPSSRRPELGEGLSTSESFAGDGKLIVFDSIGHSHWVSC